MTVDIKPAITSVTQLWRDAEKYTWELYDAWYDCKSPNFLKRVGAELVDGFWVRKVTKKQTNGLYLGKSFLDKPAASETTFHNYAPGGSIPCENSVFKDHVIVHIDCEFPKPFKFHLRPIKP